MTTPQSSDPEPPQAPRSGLSTSDFFSQRSRRQLGLFLGGAGFFAMSALITRRSIVRRYQRSIPKFYHPSNHPNYEVNGAMEAFEALNIATINVFSAAMMASGGMLWALDISSLDDMRSRVRRNLGVGGDRAEGDKQSEEEIEEWIASMLARKEFKALRGAMKSDPEEGGKGSGKPEQKGELEKKA